MGGKDDTIRLAKGSQWRFLFIDIQTGSKELALVECIKQGGFIHQTGAGRVDQNGSGLDACKAVFVDHMPCFRTQRGVQRNEICLSKSCFQRAGPLEISQILYPWRMHQHAHIERSAQHLAKAGPCMTPADNQRRLTL